MLQRAKVGDGCCYGAWCCVVTAQFHVLCCACEISMAFHCLEFCYDGG
jgi:hypothetical protein